MNASVIANSSLPVIPQVGFSFNNSGVVSSTGWITNVALDFGGIAIKFVLAGFFVYFAYRVLRSYAR
jgi:hypothetical protein